MKIYFCYVCRNDYRDGKFLVLYMFRENINNTQMADIILIVGCNDFTGRDIIFR